MSGTSTYTGASVDPGTPSKPRRRLPAETGDDFTDISTPSAFEEPSVHDAVTVFHDPEGTKATGLSINTAAPVPTPTNNHAAAPAREDYDLDPGTPLGEYRIEAKIGQGGMGVVFSAVHPLIGKRAAIKILKKELCADPHTLERFVDEARVVNQIGHPNIVDIFAFGELPDGRSYFVMEWLKGETLRARIARATLDVSAVSKIVRPLARALEAAHEKGVIHRDLKPDNVYLVDVRGEEPTVKLLDFGIAKLARNDHRVEKTATGAIVGTPQYIAPEQAKGYAIDHRADIYALGGIIFEMLTGRPPFVADNAMEMVAKHLMESPLPPSQFARGIPSELDELVLGMLAKQPEGRPSLTEVCEVLEHLKVRAATASPIGGRMQTAPVVPSSLSEVPVSGRVVSARAVSASAVSEPVSQPVASRALPPAPASKRTGIWIAIVGVPLAGLAAFLAVSATGGPPRPVTTPPPIEITKTPKSAAIVTPAPEPLEAQTAAAANITTPVSAKAETSVPAKVTTPLPATTQTPVPAKIATPVPARITTPVPAKTETAIPAKITTPPAKVAKARAKGRLKLTILGAKTDPTIVIDGAPATANTLLQVGTHVVEVRAPGMQPQKLTIEVTPSGTTTKRIQLVPKPQKTEPPKKKTGNDDSELFMPGSLTPKKR
jgi:serine/threonine protein kinase